MEKSSKMKFTGRNVFVDPSAIIGKDVRIGDNTTIYSNVVIGDRTVIANDCVIGEPLTGYYDVDSSYSQPKPSSGVIASFEAIPSSTHPRILEAIFHVATE